MAAALVAGLFVIAGSQGPAGGLVLSERLLGAAVFDSNAPGTPPGSVTYVTTYRFRAGPSLDRTAHTGVGYALVVPTDKRSFLEHLAHVFGVSGSYTTPAPGRGYWAIGSPKGRAVYYYSTNGVPRWGYVAGPCEVGASYGGPMKGCPPHPWRPHPGEPRQVGRSAKFPKMVAIALRYARGFGLGYTLAQPASPPRYTMPDYSYCGHKCVYFIVGFAMEVGGLSTGDGVGFTFNQTGQVVAAGGAAYSIGAPTTYPLLSQAAGVAAINKTATHVFTTTPLYTYVHRSPKHRGRGRVRHFTINGVLTSATTTLGMYVTSRHDLVDLPVFSYRGYTFVPRCCHLPGIRRASTQQGAWSLLALVPSQVSYKSPWQ
ncbi:MAG TPA: hypothetical protein VGZ03_01125 [Acidimicrobiales bacterium]|nr:hypothetical protein [Acidimicrobiales bacterium]